MTLPLEALKEPNTLWKCQECGELSAVAVWCPSIPCAGRRRCQSCHAKHSCLS